MIPRITLTLSPLDKTLEAIALAELLIVWLLTAIAFYKLPNTIPIHFDFSGKPDNYGSKYTLVILPIIATGVYWLLSLLNKHPHIFNYGVEITESNARVQYTNATRMLRFLKASIMLVIAMVIVLSYLNINGTTNGLGAWFLPFIFILLLAPTAFYIIKSMRKSKPGNADQ